MSGGIEFQVCGNEPLNMLCSRNFPLGANQKRTDLLANDKTSFIVKTPVQAIVGFLGAVFMLQGIHVITFDGGIPLCILTD